VAEVGETRGDRGADVAAADDAYVHRQVVARRGICDLASGRAALGGNMSCSRDENVLVIP
jgi:hypothetical protein